RSAGAGVQRNCHRTEPYGGQQRFDEPVIIREQKRHPITRPYAVVPQSPGQLSHAAGEEPVADPHRALPDRDAIRVLARTGQQPDGEVFGRGCSAHGVTTTFPTTVRSSRSASALRISSSPKT